MKLDGCMTKSKTVYCAEEGIHLSYFLSCHNGAGGRTVYDLTIEQMGSGGYEDCRLCDIATSLAMAERIWLLFTEETVTPMTAQDILEQLLSDAVFLYAEDM